MGPVCHFCCGHARARLGGAMPTDLLDLLGASLDDKSPLDEN
jgi:hypothetical protein